MINFGRFMKAFMVGLLLFGIADSITPLRAQAVYPPESIKNKEEGTVSLEFTINADGSVSDVRVAKSSGYPRLDDASVEVARSGITHLQKRMVSLLQSNGMRM